MLTRVNGAKDLDTGIELRKQVLGYLMRLELHHIFPKAKLYKHGGFSRPEVNSLGNFMFLTQDTNLKIGDRNPTEYLAHYEAKHPGILASQWIPTDPELWRYENYRAFLAERRRLLAEAANAFLDSLYAGELPETVAPTATLVPLSAAAVSVPDPGDEETLLLTCNEWVVAQGLPEGEFYVELLDPETLQPSAILDLVWQDGLQPGFSQPAALLLNEEPEVEEATNQAGYRFFTDIETFKRYVGSEILATRQAAD